MTPFDIMARNANQIIDEVVSRLTPEQKRFLDARKGQGYLLQFADQHWTDPYGPAAEWTEEMEEYRRILEAERAHQTRDPYGSKFGTVKERLGLTENEYHRSQGDSHQ